MKRLTTLQKSKLAKLARRAWQHAGRNAAEPLPDFDTWRREEVYKACGQYGLTKATNDDWCLITSRFFSILGEDGIAFEELLRSGTEHRRQLEHVLLQVLDSARLDQRYAETIARSRWDKNVSDLSDREFEQLVMTIKSRARAKQRRTQAAAA